MLIGVSKPSPSWPSAWLQDIRAWVKLQEPSGWSHVRCPCMGVEKPTNPKSYFCPHLTNEGEFQRGEVTCSESHS